MSWLIIGIVLIVSGSIGLILKIRDIQEEDSVRN